MLTVDLQGGGQEKVWCTFSPQQIDIDVSSQQGMHRPSPERVDVTDHVLLLMSSRR